MDKQYEEEKYLLINDKCLYAQLQSLFLLSKNKADLKDMLVPLILCGTKFQRGNYIEDVLIKDVAPTIAELFDVKFPIEWEKKSVLKCRLFGGR